MLGDTGRVRAATFKEELRIRLTGAYRYFDKWSEDAYGPPSQQVRQLIEPVLGKKKELLDLIRLREAARASNDSSMLCLAFFLFQEHFKTREDLRLKRRVKIGEDLNLEKHVKVISRNTSGKDRVPFLRLAFQRLNQIDLWTWHLESEQDFDEHVPEMLQALCGFPLIIGQHEGREYPKDLGLDVRWGSKTLQPAQEERLVRLVIRTFDRGY